MGRIRPIVGALILAAAGAGCQSAPVAAPGPGEASRFAGDVEGYVEAQEESAALRASLERLLSEGEGTNFDPLSPFGGEGQGEGVR
jgi:hypothetical protein